MAAQIIPSSAFKNDIYGILKAAHQDASELTSHRDVRVANKGRNIKRIVNQCLEYVRVVHPGAAHARDLVVINGTTAYQIVARACTQNRGGSNDAHFVSIDCDPTITVQKNAAELAMILETLCQNALEAVAGKKNPMVVVSLTLEKEVGRFVIEDNGPGLPMGVLDRLFPTLLDPVEQDEERPLCRGLDNAIRAARSIGGRIMMMRTGPTGAKFSVTLAADHFAVSPKVTSYRPSPASEILADSVIVDEENVQLAFEP